MTDNDNRAQAESALIAASHLPPGIGRDYTMARAQVLATLAVHDELQKMTRPTVRYTDPSPVPRVGVLDR